MQFCLKFQRQIQSNPGYDKDKIQDRTNESLYCMSLYWPAEKEARNPLDFPVALVVSLTNKPPLLEMALLGRTLPVNPDPVCTGEPEVALPRKTFQIIHLKSPKEFKSWKQQSFHKCCNLQRILDIWNGFINLYHLSIYPKMVTLKEEGTVFSIFPLNFKSC